jgi:hypothetical protein
VKDVYIRPPADTCLKIGRDKRLKYIITANKNL